MALCGGDRLTNSSTLWVSAEHRKSYTICLFLISLYLIVSLYENIKICFCVLYLCSGVGQTNLRMPQGCFGQVCEVKQLSVGEQGVLVRWEYSYSSWTLFTCEIEMLLHVVSTAGTHPQILYLFNYVVLLKVLTCFHLLLTSVWGE